MLMCQYIELLILQALFCTFHEVLQTTHSMATNKLFKLQNMYCIAHGMTESQSVAISCSHKLTLSNQ